MIALPDVSIQTQIYESATSRVYRGIRAQDGRSIVIKLLKQDYPSPQELTRYRQEYAITRSLDVEGVVKAYDQRVYQRTLLILLEDFGGESLEWWIQHHPDFCPISISTFLPLAINLISILGEIHAAGVVHKDINPGNIVLNVETSVVKIIDFGIATRFSRTNPTHKSLHNLEGTLAYLSPEQTGRMNRLLDYRTDFYSLGVTFYELLTGQLPFPTTDIFELVHCHLAKSPVPPHELNVAIPKVISDIVLKLMAKNAEDRYQNAWGIKADLERCAFQLIENGHIGSIQIGLQDVSHQFQIPQKLYGRDVEIEALLAAFNRIASGGNAVAPFKVEMMLVTGYAGIGKSAFVQELYKPITKKRGYFISGKFDQFQRNIPYSAIASALQKLVQQLLGEPETQLQQWRSRLLTALGNNGQLMIEVIPELELIMGRQSPVPEVGATETQNRFNRVFQQFIRVFCSEENPLVIFLDDLQWIDSATLKLIELMLLDEQIQFLLLIGAYRDNEVNSIHPLMLALEKLRKQGAILQQIMLKPLTLQPMNQLIAEVVHQDIATVQPLAELVLRKTEGNPFFVGEFLRSLYHENLLSFSVEHQNWQWDIAQIQMQNITDNVVELLLSQLKKLPVMTQQFLQVAACIGTEFDLETLAIVCERSPQTISQDLLAAAQAGLIQPISELDVDLLVQEYKFLHDRVQQAAYALIDEPQKQVVHLQIGRNLLEKTVPEQCLERLFEIVDHLNHGIELVIEQSERNQIAHLNLTAGQKAKGAIAYDMAQNYLAMGRSWLAASSWQTTYDLTLALYLETTEVAYLCGEFEQVEHWGAIALQNARDILDSIKVYEFKIQTNIAQKQFLEATNTALQILQQFGISFPEQLSQSNIQLELDFILSLIREKAIEDFADLPEMTELDKLAAMRILSSVTMAAQIAVPDLVPLLVSKQVNLSIQYGNSFSSPFAYASFGRILCIMQNISTGYQFGLLALKLLSKPYTHILRARTLYIVSIYIMLWHEHIEKTSKRVLAAYQVGLETGDLEFAAYSALTYCSQCFFWGQDLVELERETGIYCEAIRQINQKAVVEWVQVYWQCILNLMGFSVNPTVLIGEAYDERHLTHDKTDEATLSLVLLNKVFLGYLFYEYPQSVENSVKLEPFLAKGKGSTMTPFHCLYDSLARLATYSNNQKLAQEEILQIVAANQKKMKQWADHAPMNYLHKYHLVEAEKSRVLRQLLEAEEFYEQAIQGARENGYIQEEALAYELAAKFYLERGREKIAQTYMKESHYCYARWGATAKVNDLQARYPQFFTSSPSPAAMPFQTTVGSMANASQVTFDLAAVLKASQAISREMELEHLLNSLMQILIQNAGARTGYLILENAGEWVIEAACEFNDASQSYVTQVLQSIPIINCLPESIIQYVIRTYESVILNDATHEGRFVNDPYIQNHPTQSILCLPLLNQSKLVGVLYLENQLTTGVFTPERFSQGDVTRTQILHLLSTQAAIAIENAKLYAKLQSSENRIAQFLEAVPVGIIAVDPRGHLDYFNQRAIQLLGQGIDSSIVPGQLSETYQLYQAGTDQFYPADRLPGIQALSGKQSSVDDIEIHQNNVAIPVEVWGTPIFDEQGHVIYAIAAFQDITERKQAEKLLADYNRTLEQQVAERTAALQKSESELRKRERELRLITDALPVGIAYVDANQQYRFVNHTYTVWCCCDQDDILGKSIREFIGDRIYSMVEPYINQVLAGQTTTFEEEISLPSGNKYLNTTLIPNVDANAQVIGFYTLNLDISDRKRAEATSILEERNRMAREIHDTLAQAFTGILVQVGGATQVLADDLEATQAHLEMIEELARTGLSEARRSVAALRPQFLEQGDLSSALHHLVTQMRAATNTNLSYETKGTAYPLPIEVENNLLRMGQEALTNAIKYAEANTIWVELVYEATNCILRVKDDGRGFGVGSVPLVGGFGLLGMSERAEHIGAQLTIQSQPGQGTEIVVIVSRA